MGEGDKHPILVVDDEPEILYSLRSLLRPEFEVRTAASAREAMAVLADHPVHVVMTDQRMPEMTGVEFLSRIRTEHPDAIRLIFTGYADIKAVIDAINQGNVYRYITKPWDPDELRAVLHEACRQYEQIVERKRLLHDLRDCHAQHMALFDGLRDGRYGALNAAGRAEAAKLAGTGRGLLESLDRMVLPQPRGPVA